MHNLLYRQLEAQARHDELRREAENLRLLAASEGHHTGGPGLWSRFRPRIGDLLARAREGVKGAWLEGR